MKILFSSIILLTNFFSLSVTFAQTFPPYTISQYDSSSTGFYFTCPFKIGSNPNGIVPTHMIMDGAGNVIYFKRFALGQNTGDFKLHSNGLMSFSFQGMFFIMDSTFTVIDSVFCKNGIITDSHDMQMLPNGNFLLLGYEYIQMDLSGYPLFGTNNIPGSSTANVICGVIQELDPLKNVVFEWHAKDYFAFDDVDEAWLNNPNVVDWTHFNAVEQDMDGNILISTRHFNEITKINRLTGAVIWRLGGNANMFNFINDPMQFKRQHDVRRISNGNLTLFDNGLDPPGPALHFATGKEYQLDETALTALMVWSYTDDVTEHSPSMGNFLRNPGGNSMVNYGNSATQNKVFSMMNDLGQKVFEISFDDTLRTYRSFNFPTLPWNLNRPIVTCYENAGQHYLDAGSGFASYLWSNGATTQVIPISSAGTYSVFVPKGQGGFIRSEFFEVYNMTEPCGLTGLQEQIDNNLVVAPNPVHEMLSIEIKQLSDSQPVVICNTTGQIVFTTDAVSSDNLKISVSDWPPGIYWIRYLSGVTKIVKY